ncbi:NAD-dependent protein deacetylase sirtuin-3, mitochondrial isoform X1 [Varanus komodoensis]|uniref:Sirtuin 3 n=1 Tax=Varanus komodoensis TaxID=61221 RepID=A0A8D2J0W3_VARKO|nr:NAD-dependent protein deacetylase sirtuin-3, mitochondrial isoform X1 [Varanus komodoensis]XP_044281962.1 NAD-dependent protein deacetylase sirtuin-3, mitochondrial isoform X1 [Varanus komodoensis]XP_044281964.1 NAD-dependent protein deacetylase sirtuin-3, mitochondrial isoform X1 [Varanus komodoensis]
MNWKLHFRVSGGTNALCAGNFQRLMGWRYRWICVQHHHYRSPSGSVPFKNQSLISLRSVFNHPNGNLLLKRTSESSMKNMASMSGVRIMGVRPFSLSTAPMIIFGVGRGGNNTGKDKLTLKNVAELIQKKECRRVLVMAGAGLSTPSGIPDFRSPGSGLYSNLQQYNIPYPEAIFELNYFFHNPKPFFMLAKELYPGNYRPNYAHYFLRLLLDKGLLLRLYTQNIDGLERVAGIPPDKLVEAHGTFASATCTVCQRSYPGEDFRVDVMADKIPKCPVCTGIVKPDIVFFGEELPRRFFLHMTDFPMADLLFVIGTSLEVEPFASLAGAVRASVPRVLINRDLVGPFAYQPQHSDVAELGDVIRGVKKVVELLGWKEELEELIKKEKEKLDAKNKKDV